MATYVPGTLETDQKKVIMSLQQIGPRLDLLSIAGTGLVNSSGSLAVSLSSLTASLGADVALNNTVAYFDGPSVAQGTSGTWFASGTVTLIDTASGANFLAKLWDGTTVIASSEVNSNGLNVIRTISLSGVITSPAGNIRISCADITATTGKILFNQTGQSKDSTISVIRIA